MNSGNRERNNDIVYIVLVIIFEIKLFFLRFDNGFCMMIILLMVIKRINRVEVLFERVVRILVIV